MDGCGCGCGWGWGWGWGTEGLSGGAVAPCRMEAMGRGFTRSRSLSDRDLFLLGRNGGWQGAGSEGATGA